jgi:AGCS family alanine or glycine:cation symporter
VFIYLGAVGSLHLVWDIADTLNALMAVPNLVSVLISIPLLRQLQREFFGGTHRTGDRHAEPASAD